MLKLCIKECSGHAGVILFLWMIKVWKQKGELFYYVAIEYLYYKLHGIHAVQGLDGKNEMIVHKQICYY